MSRDGWRPHLEGARCLDLVALFRDRALRSSSSTSGIWQWTRDGERIASISYSATLGEETGELRLSYTWTPGDEPLDAICNIRLSSRPLPYGGRYWYMHCPYTRRRARKLYKFGPIEQFCHRTAIRPLPTYAIQRLSGSDRVNAQRWALRRKIGDDFSDLFGEPCKPKWMRWRTFERYARRDAELADRDEGYLLRFVGRLMAKTGG
jgi:hypothetical protein